MKRRSEKERREIVEAYRRSGMTQETYAARHGINVGWLIFGLLAFRPR